MTQAAQSTKGITASDILSQWNGGDLINPRTIQHQFSNTTTDEQSLTPVAEEKTPTPRRCQSMVDIGVDRQRRESSMPPTIDEESRADEEKKEAANTPVRSQISPKRRVTDCERLSDVQAYTLLNASEDGTQEIQS